MLTVMEQTKALIALEPFLALSKTASSPRAAADLVSRATAAPNTYLFAELLQTPAIQSLASSDFASHLDLLKIFSYGTFATYSSTPDLPSLSDAQALKLRQLSLLTLARDRTNLSYDALQKALVLNAPREVEDLVVSAVYAGLLQAKLDPARAAVQVSSVAPLRDLSPGAIPGMIAALTTWSDRCTSTLSDLETQIKDVRAAAATRQREERAADEKLQRLIEQETGKSIGAAVRDLTRKTLNKRSVMDVGAVLSEEQMDLDEPDDEPSRRVSKRKL